MRILVQRVKSSNVCVEKRKIAEIGYGLLALVGVGKDDTVEDIERLAKKLSNLRIFEDGQGKMNLNLKQADGKLLSVPLFTLYADTRKGNRPSFTRAAPPQLAETLYETYVAALRAELGRPRVATGRFGAMMSVEILNDGPVTIELTTDSGQS